MMGVWADIVYISNYLQQVRSQQYHLKDIVQCHDSWLSTPRKQELLQSSVLLDHLLPDIRQTRQWHSQNGHLAVLNIISQHKQVRLTVIGSDQALRMIQRGK